MPYVVFKGGLGNLLFQYAFFLHLKRKIPKLKIDLSSNLSTGLPEKSRFNILINDFSVKTKENKTHGIDKSFFSKFILIIIIIGDFHFHITINFQTSNFRLVKMRSLVDSRVLHMVPGSDF